MNIMAISAGEYTTSPSEIPYDADLCFVIYSILADISSFRILISTQMLIQDLIGKIRAAQRLSLSAI